MRWIKRIALTLFALYLAALTGLFVVMHNPDLFGRVMRHVPGPAFMVIPFKSLWSEARAGRLQAGEPAPGFDLPTAGKSSHVSLASFRGHKPVVLVFGSYT